MAKMLNLSQQNNECSEDELIDRFKNVEMQTAELSPTSGNSPSQMTPPINVLQYIEDPGFTYVDFARRGVTTDIPPTFRVQDYSWDDHGYSLVNRLYNDVGYLLDVKFRATYNLTYCTMVSLGRISAYLAHARVILKVTFNVFYSFCRLVEPMWTRRSSVVPFGITSSASTGYGTMTTIMER